MIDDLLDFALILFDYSEDPEMDEELAMCFIEQYL